MSIPSSSEPDSPDSSVSCSKSPESPARCQPRSFKCAMSSSKLVARSPLDRWSLSGLSVALTDVSFSRDRMIADRHTLVRSLVVSVRSMQAITSTSTSMNPELRRDSIISFPF